MDISFGKAVAAREEEGTVVHVKDETGASAYYGDNNDKPVTMTIVGSYSARFRRVSEAARDRNMKRRAAIDSKQLDADNRELYAECVLAWDGIFSGKEPLPLSRANVIAVFVACPWVFEQIVVAVNDHAAFFAAS